MTEIELLGTTAKNTGFKVLVFIAALILPSLLVWACLGFIVWNWSPIEWTEALRAVGIWFSLVFTVAAVGFAGGVA
jgi:hypothetical protein